MKRLEWISVALVVVLMGAVMWFRCTYGGVFCDELYSWAMPMRYCNDEIPFVTDLSTHVLSGVLMMPFYKMMCWLGLEREGMLLFTRRFFVVCWLLFLLVSYFRWRSWSRCGAALGVLAIAMIPPRYIYCLHYNSFAFMGMMMAMTLYVTESSHRRLDWFLSGVSYCVAVVSVPHLALAYVLVAMHCLFKNRTALVWITIGGAFMAVVYMMGLFSMVSLNEICSGIQLVASGEAHVRSSLFAHLYAPVSAISYSLGGHVFIYAYFMLIILSFVIGSSRIRILFIAPLLIVVIGFSYLFFAVFQDANTLNTMLCQLPFLTIGLIVVFRDWQLMRRVLPVYVWAGGFAFLFAIASNTGVRASSTGVGISVVASVVTLVGLIKRIKMISVGRPCLIALSVVLAAHFLIEYAVAPIKEMPTEFVELKSGPNKGTYVDARRAKMMEGQMADLTAIQGDKMIKNLFVVEWYSVWQNLATDKRIAAPSAWCGDVNERLLKNMRRYWDRAPDNKPDAIYVTSSLVDRFDTVFVSSDLKEVFKRDDLPSGNVIYRRVNDF